MSGRRPMPSVLFQIETRMSDEQRRKYFPVAKQQILHVIHGVAFSAQLSDI